ncbi:MAG: hypothetical protein J6X72_02940 [Clostridia bacterium]|nr:hypothetical protein [Clostridia bacterium]
MGFGILLFGYDLYLNTIIPIYTIPVAGIVMAFGLRKLKIWNSGFRGAANVNFAVIVCGLSVIGLRVAILSGASVSDTLTSAASAVLFLTVTLFHFFLGSGMVSLAREVGLSRLRSQAFFFRTVSCIFWFLYAFFNLDLGEKLDAFLVRLVVPMVVVGFVVGLVGFAVLFSCYTDIGMPDEKYAPVKPGFFARLKQKNEEEKKNDD